MHRSLSKLLLGVVIVALIIAAIVVVATHHNNRAAACREQGGTVHVDHDTKRIKDTATGKWKTKTTTEHECIIGGREAFEW